MKFELEKIDTAYIVRRVLEEDAKSDRKVTKVLLTPAEWHEFRLNMECSMRYCTPDFDHPIREWRVPIPEPVSLSKPLEYYRGPRVVTVVRA